MRMWSVRRDPSRASDCPDPCECPWSIWGGDPFGASDRPDPCECPWPIRGGFVRSEWPSRPMWVLVNDCVNITDELTWLIEKNMSRRTFDWKHVPKDFWLKNMFQRTFDWKSIHENCLMEKLLLRTFNWKTYLNGQLNEKHVPEDDWLKELSLKDDWLKNVS